MGKTFINLSNLHTNKWPKDRLKAAKEIADGEEIINVAFPLLKADSTKEMVYEKASETVKKVMSYNPDVVFCQGEFSLCFRMVELLKEEGVSVVTSCNERIENSERTNGVPFFRFVQFREF